MKHAILAAGLFATAVLAAAAFGDRAYADDETGDTAITVRAPVDATNCTASPPTITLLGLTIDVTAVNAQSDDNQGDDNQGDGQGDDGQGDDTGTGTGGCAAIQIGQTVEVTLASDTPDAITGL